jgi:hypothetical protein
VSPDDLDEAARALADGNSAPLIAALAEMGMTTPDVLWDPRETDLPDRRLRGLLAYWRGLRADKSDPRLADVDPVAMGDAVGYAMLLEALPEGDFRYRLYGTRIAERAGFDMTGKRTSKIPTHPSIAAFFGAVYRAAAMRRAPVFTRHAPPSRINVVHWTRLVLPLSGEGGRCDFLVGNIPGEPRPIA